MQRSSPLPKASCMFQRRSASTEVLPRSPATQTAPGQIFMTNDRLTLVRMVSVVTALKVAAQEPVDGKRPGAAKGQGDEPR